MICGYRPTPSGGGTEKYVYELTRGLLQRGVEVDVICEDRPFLPDAANPLANHLLGIEPQSLSSRTLVEQFREKSRRLAQAIEPTRYDLVHCHGQYGFHTALRWSELTERPPLISSFHLTALGPNERYRQLGLGEPPEASVDGAVAFMEETTGRLSDKCIAVSRGVAAEVTKFYGVQPERVQVISNWYDPDIFRPLDRSNARRILGLESGERYLLYVGHFNMSRGAIMAAALRRLPHSITLLVAHHDEDRTIIAEFGKRVRFTGHLAPETLALYYSAADVLCFPSLYGGFGLVLIEAMACGCPPVVFNYGAMNEVVTGESGYLVMEPTPAAYAAKIAQALSDNGRKASAARTRAQAFVMDVQIDAVLNVYRAAVRRRSKSNVENGEAYIEYRVSGPGSF
ncbi:MAG: glycosyltransferase family 4 protein [Candidatus Eremiobacteraeota bacterium]|nr:glycosyltransferase family 4 protein [Candidatus Eremiobacteraeota bacterium]